MGPLAGIRIIEIAGIGAAPFAAMMLADMGAEVLRVERPGGNPAARWPEPAVDVLSRGRRCAAIDLKHPEGRQLVLDLVAEADGLIEANRPGVMERLGLGPDDCLARNRRLVYGRLTGWGQEGPLAQAAGHDLNYIALSGALSLVGRAGQPPTPTLNFLGDLAGGAMIMAFGLVCALLESGHSGQGQVVDAAMVDGAALLTAMQHGMDHAGYLLERGQNMIDSGAHFYDCYETADHQYVSVASVEPQFYRELLVKLGLDDTEFPEMDMARWPELKGRFATIFKTKTRREWCDLLEGSDACFAPVLSLREATTHPHNVARDSFVKIGGVTQPRPAPRFSRTDATIPRLPARVGEHSEEALADWGVPAKRIAWLLANGVVARK